MSAEPKPQPQFKDKVEQNPLAEVVEEVRRDAEQRPADYARETLVPEGGE